MKTLILFLTLVLTPLTTPEHTENNAHIQQSQSVYICVSENAVRYHFNRKCRGLSNCKREIRQVSISAAKSKGLTKCKLE